MFFGNSYSLLLLTRNICVICTPQKLFLCLLSKTPMGFPHSFAHDVPSPASMHRYRFLSLWWQCWQLSQRRTVYEPRSSRMWARRWREVLLLYPSLLAGQGTPPRRDLSSTNKETKVGDLLPSKKGKQWPYVPQQGKDHPQQGKDQKFERDRVFHKLRHA